MLTLNDGRSELWQWDTSRKLTVDAECSQVHFSNKVFGRSVDVDVVDGVASIPDFLLQTDKELMAWAFVGTAENGYTKISKAFKVNRRNKPADYVFTPPEQATLGEILERLDDIESAQDPDAIKNAVEDYLEQNPVEAPVQSVNGKTGAVNLTAEDVGALPDDTQIPTVPDWVKPIAAEVGQYFRVSAVDENGKLTEWEAVDLPSGGDVSGGGNRFILADFTLEEDVDGFTIPLNDDPFNYSSLLITITATRIADGENQYMGFIYNGTSRAAVCHLNGLFDATSQKTAVVKVDLFKTKIFTLAHKSGSYQWNTTAHYSFAYDIEPYNSGDGNVLRFENSSAVAGSRLTVEGVK